MFQVTTATTLMNNMVDEQFIMQRTGHRSVNSVRTYKRPSPALEKSISNMLQPPYPAACSASSSSDGASKMSTLGPRCDATVAPVASPLAASPLGAPGVSSVPKLYPVTTPAVPKTDDAVSGALWLLMFQQPCLILSLT